MKSIFTEMLEDSSKEDLHLKLDDGTLVSEKKISHRCMEIGQGDLLRGGVGDLAYMKVGQFLRKHVGYKTKFIIYERAVIMT